MSSSEEDIILAYWAKRRRRRQHKYWVHPYIQNNRDRGTFICARELHHYEDRFNVMYRMSKESFYALAEHVRPLIAKKNTNYRDSISVEERLLITLRYLGTGASMQSLALYFAKGQGTVSRIISETVITVWTVLQPIYMPTPDKVKWETISNKFDELWNLPHCIGSIDGKHVRMQKLPGGASCDYNYKGYHSTVLLACADAEGNFITIEAGFYGRMHDAGVFRSARLGQWLDRNGLDIPDSRVLPRDVNEVPFPFYFIADAAFPLKTRLLIPYKQRGLTNIRRIFNYRLSRARRVVECAFGMMARKFQILQSCIVSTKRKHVANIVKACCILHNFVRKREAVSYTPSDINDDPTARPDYMQSEDFTLANHRPASYRAYLANYFISEGGCIPLQWKYCIEDQQPL